MTLPGWGRGLTVAFYALVAWLVARYVAALDLRLLTDVSLDSRALVGAVAAALAYRFLLTVAWRSILRDFTAVRIPYAELNLIYAASWIGRYIPGKISGLAARVHFGHLQGLERGAVFVSAIVETSLHLLACTFVGLAGLGLSGRALGLRPALLAVAVALGVFVLAALHPRHLNGLLRLLARLMKKQGLAERLRVTGPTVTRGFSAVLFVHAIAGVGWTFLAASLADVGPGDFLFVWAVFSFSGAVGAAAIFAPAGLGVREAVLLPLLSALMRPETALLLTLAFRISEAICDGLYFCLSHVLRFALGTAGLRDLAPAAGQARSGGSNPGPRGNPGP